MKHELHRCAASSCVRQVPVYLLMCINHWRMVPAALQREVHDAWAARKARPVDADAAHWHAEATQKAVAAVATKQITKATRRAEEEGDLFAFPTTGESQHFEEEHGNPENTRRTQK